MPHLQLTTKAKTLQALRPLVHCSKVLPAICLTVGDVRYNRETVITSIQKGFSSPFLIIRSSARAEDNLTTSNAGHFCSVLNVSRLSREEINRALDDVVMSYGECDANEELFVQPMLENISMSGVVFTAVAPEKV